MTPWDDLPIPPKGWPVVALASVLWPVAVVITAACVAVDHLLRRNQ